MSLLEKMGLIEKIPEEINYDEVTENYNEDSVELDVSAEYSENCDIADFVEDVYIQNDLHDKSHSIFKVEELMNSLPKEMVTDTKKKSVLSILNNFGLTADEVFVDGEKRLKTLSAVLEKLNADNELAVKDMQKQIEEHKKAIADLESQISVETENTRKSNEVINTEIERIKGLIEFIGGAE